MTLVPPEENHDPQLSPEQNAEVVRRLSNPQPRVSSDEVKDFFKRLTDVIEPHAREIEARRSGVYVMNDDERHAVRQERDQADRGEFVSDESVRDLWK